jgi:ATP-dependent Lon protease
MNPHQCKIIYLHNKILFPHGTIQISSTPSNGIQLKVGETLLIYTFRSVFGVLNYKKRIVTVAKVTKEINAAGDPMVELKGIGRARLSRRLKLNEGTFIYIAHDKIDGAEELADKIRKMAQQFVFLIDIPESDRLIYLMTFITQLNELIDFISHYFITNQKKKWKLYTELDLEKKSLLLLSILESMINEVTKKLESGKFE